MTTLSGYQVLEVAPNRSSVREASVDRSHTTATTPTGLTLAATIAPAGEVHDLEWICPTRADLAVLESFLDDRTGRQVAAWIPTYTRDATVLSSTAFGWTVTKRSDVADVGSLVASARHWQWWCSQTSGGASYRAWHLTSVTDNGDGTETWNGTSPTGSASIALTSAQGGVFSRLMLCRMERDSYTVRYQSGAVTIVSAAFRELPEEAP